MGGERKRIKGPGLSTEPLLAIYRRYRMTPLLEVEIIFYHIGAGMAPHHSEFWRKSKEREKE